jgi:serine/threonine protein kinase
MPSCTTDYKYAEDAIMAGDFFKARLLQIVGDRYDTNDRNYHLFFQSIIDHFPANDADLSQKRAAIEFLLYEFEHDHDPIAIQNMMDALKLAAEDKPHVLFYLYMVVSAVNIERLAEKREALREAKEARDKEIAAQQKLEAEYDYEQTQKELRELEYRNPRVMPAFRARQRYAEKSAAAVAQLADGEIGDTFELTDFTGDPYTSTDPGDPYASTDPAAPELPATKREKLIAELLSWWDWAAKPSITSAETDFYLVHTGDLTRLRSRWARLHTARQQRKDKHASLSLVKDFSLLCEDEDTYPYSLFTYKKLQKLIPLAFDKIEEERRAAAIAGVGQRLLNIMEKLGYLHPNAIYSRDVEPERITLAVKLKAIYFGISEACMYPLSAAEMLFTNNDLRGATIFLLFIICLAGGSIYMATGPAVMPSMLIMLISVPVVFGFSTFFMYLTAKYGLSSGDEIKMKRWLIPLLFLSFIITAFAFTMVATQMGLLPLLSTNLLFIIAIGTPVISSAILLYRAAFLYLEKTNIFSNGPANILKRSIQKVMNPKIILAELSAHLRFFKGKKGIPSLDKQIIALKKHLKNGNSPASYFGFDELNYDSATVQKLACYHDLPPKIKADRQRLLANYVTAIAACVGEQTTPLVFKKHAAPTLLRQFEEAPENLVKSTAIEFAIKAGKAAALKELQSHDYVGDYESQEDISDALTELETRVKEAARKEVKKTIKQFISRQERLIHAAAAADATATPGREHLGKKASGEGYYRKRTNYGTFYKSGSASAVDFSSQTATTPLLHAASGRQ